jgi:dCMP deaminase
MTESGMRLIRAFVKMSELDLRAHNYRLQSTGGRLYIMSKNMGMQESDEYFMKLARNVGDRANCTHRHVGAIVVSSVGCVVGIGWNRVASPLGVQCEDGGCPRGLLPRGFGRVADYANCGAVHAEWMAMLEAGIAGCNGAVMYVCSEPCRICVRMMHGAGIAVVVWCGMLNGYDGNGDGEIVLDRNAAVFEARRLARLRGVMIDGVPGMDVVDGGDLL